ncbi:MAG: arginine N-succinyltransferase [Sphingomonas sp.]
MHSRIPPTDTPFVRPVCAEDIEALLALAALTGGGMTNLPADREALSEKIAWSERSLAETITAPEDEFYLLVLEDGHGRVIGTASIFSRLGARWPFYSYKRSRVTHVSRDLERTFSTHLLHLVNDFDGATEVGGLFLHPSARTGGLGGLLARSRYLFIARHRERFADTVIADLRGWIADGRSPFWDAIAGPFFGSDFHDADFHNALHGNQFIADLMPRYPIYISMLPEAAREAIGRPHDASVAALRMLEAEGFIHDGYCDIFDGGPTVHARTDAIRTVRSCDGEAAISACAIEGCPALLALGNAAGFRAWQGTASLAM